MFLPGISVSLDICVSSRRLRKASLSQNQLPFLLVAFLVGPFVFHPPGKKTDMYIYVYIYVYIYIYWLLGSDFSRLEFFWKHGRSGPGTPGHVPRWSCFDAAGACLRQRRATRVPCGALTIPRFPVGGATPAHAVLGYVKTNP